MKRIIPTLLVALTSMMSYAQSFVRDHVTYTILSQEEKSLEVTAYEIDAMGNNLDADIPSEVTYMGDPYQVVSVASDAFQGLAKLRSISLPNTVKTIPGSAFRDCTGLTQIKLSDSLKAILDFTFYNCSSLKEVALPVTLPASVDSVGNYAFEGCLGLRELHCQNPVPPVVGDEGVFYAVENCTLSVPIGSKPFYAEAPGWNEFTDIVEEEPQSLASVPESSASILVSYSVDGKPMLDDSPGFRIARGRKVVKY